jgi:hypothetical protein
MKRICFLSPTIEIIHKIVNKLKSLNAYTQF